VFVLIQGVLVGLLWPTRRHARSECMAGDPARFVIASPPSSRMPPRLGSPTTVIRVLRRAPVRVQAINFQHHAIKFQAARFSILLDGPELLDESRQTFRYAVVSLPGAEQESSLDAPPGCNSPGRLGAIRAI